MIIVCPTIPKTGSRFLIDHLLGGYPKYQNESKDGVVFRHLASQDMPEVRGWLRNNLVVVPLRHPVSCARSWCARGWRKKIPDLTDYWRRLMYVVDRYDVSYVPIDVPNRDEWLRLLNERLPTPVETDWPVVNGIKTPKDSAILNPEELQLIVDMMSEREGFFDRFGYFR